MNVMTTSNSGMPNPGIERYAMGLIGAAIGGTIGYFAFSWLAQQGFYGMMLPGALLGFGCATASRIKSIPLGIACAIAAIGLAIFIEWSFFPFVADPSFTFFVENLFELKPMKLILIALGGLFAFWFGMGRERFARQATPRW